MKKVEFLRKIKAAFPGVEVRMIPVRSWSGKVTDEIVRLEAPTGFVFEAAYGKSKVLEWQTQNRKDYDKAWDWFSSKPMNSK